jgi:choline dehydrogenase-like flavoprotein
MTALSIVHQLEALYATSPPSRKFRVLMLERGTWWTTPVETVQDKEVRTRELLLKRLEPTQEWSTANDLHGVVDLITRCRRTVLRPLGLYEFTTIGKRGLTNDGVAILRASGVGGGSLVYSNITIRPPETVFQDRRWPGLWGSADARERDRLYALAANAISYSVEYAIKSTAGSPTTPAMMVNTGLSKIVTRSARFTPSWNAKYQIVLAGAPNGYASELIDRARVFQTAVQQLNPDQWGTVDLAINDLDMEGVQVKPRGRNYCERQGRCNVGCLPGARHTLNKQLFRMLFGQLNASLPLTEPNNPNPNPAPLLKNVDFQLRTLTEVDYVTALSTGGYRINYRRATARDPQTAIAGAVEADRLVIAAGCVGTVEIMLRSQRRATESGGVEGLPGLGPRVGEGFSTNGDYVAFLTPTKEHTNLTRGPVTTSFAQFNTSALGAEGFCNLEDQGMPKALGGLVGYGIPLMQSLAHGEGVPGAVLAKLADLIQGLAALRPQRHSRPTQPEDLSGDRPEAGDELTAKMMCVVAQGKEAANGKFRLEGDLLRLSRTDGRRFVDDPIYGSIRGLLSKLAPLIRDPSTNASFENPFESAGLGPIATTSHPLGGCPMGSSIQDGVVDEWGRVFRADVNGNTRVYGGLYIADASVVPAALGVNPSLTISAIALRAAESMLREVNARATAAALA